MHNSTSMLVCPRVSVLAVLNEFRFSDLYPSYSPWYVQNEIRLRLLLVALVGKHLPWPRWGLQYWTREACHETERPSPNCKTKQSIQGLWNPLKVIKSSGWNPNKTHATFATILLGVGVLARSNLAPNLLSAQWPFSLGRDCGNKTLGTGCHNMISPWCWQTWSRKWCYITNKLHTHVYIYILYSYVLMILMITIYDSSLTLGSYGKSEIPCRILVGS